MKFNLKPAAWLILLFFAFGISAEAQLLEQTFSASSTVSAYASATPGNGQMDAITTSGAGMVLSINTTGSNKLRFARTGNAGAFSRITDFSPVPSTLMYRFDLAVSGNSVAQTTAAAFQVGSGFGTANSSEANANTHSRIGLNWTATAGQFSIRNLVAGLNSNNYSGTQTILWVINNSGNPQSYKAPDGTVESVANDAFDLWIGSTREFNEAAATTATQTLTDLKFAFSAGTGTVDIDNILIDPIPTAPSLSGASGVGSGGFTANWTPVSGATGYRIDVSTASDFSSFVPGYNDLAVAGTSQIITGLSASTTYFYRVRTERTFTVGTFTSGHSASQSQTTSPGGGPIPSVAIGALSSANFNTNPGSFNVVLHRFDLATTLADATLTGISLTSSGTYLASDLLNFKIRYSTDNVLDAGDATLSTKTTGLGPGIQNFSGWTNQTIANGNTGWIFVTMDVSATATGGSQVQISPTALSAFSFVSATTTGSDPTLAGPLVSIQSVPVVASPSSAFIGINTASLGGDISSTGGTGASSISERGIYWSTVNGFTPPGTGTKVSASGAFGTGLFTQPVSGLPSGTLIYFRAFAANSVGEGYSAQASFSTLKPEPDASPGLFSCGANTTTSIPLSWLDATSGSTNPDGYLIRWSSVDFASIPDPVDGTPVANGSNAFNISQGVQNYTVSGLVSGTTYFFKIFPYTNSGSNINFRLISVQTTSCNTQAGPWEDFELGTKSGYTAGSVTCTAGSWTMDEALLGTSASDVKNGAQSVRMRNAGGSLSMNFDLTSGLGTVTVNHALYGTDGSSTWRLEASTDAGTTWVAYVSPTITTSSASLTSQSFTLNIPGTVRFRIFRVTGTSSTRINIDDIYYTTYTACTAPGATLTVSASNLSSSGADLSWTGAAGDGTMIVLRPSSAGNLAPTNSVVYTANADWNLAGQINSNNRVVFRSAGTTVNGITNLSPETRYTATAYNYNTTGSCYQLVAPASTQFYTWSPAPLAHAASFSATAVAFNQINLNFTASGANADGYLILRKTGSAPTGLPVNGVAYTVGSTVGDAQVAEIVSSNAAVSAIIGSLSATTPYFFSLIPYNWDGTNAATYHYLTSGPIPQANATTLVQPSQSSDILADNSYAYSSNISYSGFQNATASSTGVSVGVFKFSLRDGGGAADSDLLPTILDGLTIQATNIANIRAAALFTGVTQSTFVASATVGTDLVFSNLASIGANVTAADGGSRDFTLRLTFQSVVTDNQQLQFTITQANTQAAGSSTSSLFAGFTAQQSSTTGDRNRIEVTATTIDFGIQPVSTGVNAAIPAFTLRAEDALGNLDLDENTCSVSLTKSPSVLGNLSSSSPYTFSSGLITISNAVFDQIETGVTVRATAQSCLGNTQIISNPFNIQGTVYVLNDYQSQTGTGLSWTNANHWRRHNGTSWGAFGADGIPSSIRRVYIQGSMSTSGSQTANEIIVESGGNLTVSSPSTATSKCLVKDGGVLTLNATFTSSGVFEIENNGEAIVNYAATNASSLWNGQEIFHEASIFTIQNWGANTATTAFRPVYNGINIDSNTFSGSTAVFGHLNIDISTNLSNTLVLIADGVKTRLAHGDLTIKSTAASQTVGLISSGTVRSGIGGTLTVDDFYAPAEAFQFNSTGGLDFTIGGDLQLDGATTRGMAGGTVGAYSNIYVLGNMNVTPSAVYTMNSTNTGNCVVNLYLKGDLTVAGSANINTGGGLGIGNYSLHFNGTGDGSSPAQTQEVDIASTSTTVENRNVTFRVKSGAYVRLVRDLELGINSELRVETGGVFDFGFNGTTPLIVGISGSSTGTTFTSETGSTLKITSPDGISLTGSIGNVQVTPSNRSFNQTATFWYIGKQNQVTGTGISLGSTPRILIAELADNSLTLTPTNYIQISSGGRLDIRQGIVVETDLTPISGSGKLVMTGGVYRSSILSIALPQLSAYSSYSLTGGFIELNGNGSQVLSGAPAFYHGIRISNAGTKTITSAIVVNSLLEISQGTFDIGSNGVTGNGGLTMTGGLFRIGKSSGATFPELLGIANPYSLTGGTIELYGTSSVGTPQLLRGTFGSPSQNIQYYNVELNSNSGNLTGFNVNAQASFSVAGVFNVNPPTVFQLDYDDVISGPGTFNLLSGTLLKYAHPQGITLPSCGVSSTCGAVICSNRTFSGGASYALVGNQPGMVSGSGLPASVPHLYVQRGGNAVSLSQNLSIQNSLEFSGTGMLLTGSNTVTLSATGTVTEMENAHLIGKIQTTRTLGNTLETFGGIGLQITALGAAPGSTLVIRENGIAIIGAGNTAISRKFDIHPTLNSGLNASLTISYFDDEINGLLEGDMSLYRSEDAGITWDVQSSVPVPALNQVGGTGFNGFSTWTIADYVAPLPVSWKSFRVQKVGRNALVQWETASESELSHFEVWKSEDGKNYQKLTQFPSRNPVDGAQYRFTDAQFRFSSFYKVIPVHFDGSLAADQMGFLAKEEANMKSTLFPNPGNGEVQILVPGAIQNQEVEVQISDLTGKVLHAFQAKGAELSAPVQVQLQALPSGMYRIRLRGEAAWEESHLYIRK